MKGDYDNFKSYIYAKKPMSMQLAEKLLRDVPVDEKGHRGQTLLMHACQAGRADLVALLIEKNANVNLGDQEQETALVMTARKGNVDIITLLLDHGAHINAVNKHGQSALTYSISSGNLDGVKKLVDGGADINLTGPLGMNAFAISMMLNKPEIAQYLLEHGADRSAYDNLEEEKTTFIQTKGKFFPGVTADLSLGEYLQLKSMLQFSAGIGDPGNWEPDPTFSTPENTWAYYKKMLIEGEVEKALACHQPDSAEDYREIYKALGKDKTAKMVREMNEIEQITIDGQSAKYRLRREIDGELITFYVYFDNLFGEWKIRVF
jgi:hypothetical protein